MIQGRQAEFTILHAVDKLPLGNATAAKSLDELLTSVDFVSLHVPDTDRT